LGDTLVLFLINVALISLTGILMPGPVTAAAITSSRSLRWGGLAVGAGHCLVEIPVVALLFLGAESVFKEPMFQRVLGLSGGMVMVWMGGSMIRSRNSLASSVIKTSETESQSVNSPVKAGILTSLGNPYIFLWWATVGAGMVAQGERFGAVGLVGLAAVHWMCDLGWDAALGFSSYGILGKVSNRVQSTVFAVCGLTLIGFGIRFFLLGIF
jgi:threonine/homoserine/homoserine lactone efflux protein